MKINLHTHHYAPLTDTTEVVNQYPEAFNPAIPYYSIGIHPWYIDEDKVKERLLLMDIQLSGKGALAIGECGLDKRIETGLDLQIEVYKQQVLLAEKHKKPIILHCVAAYQEIVELKKKWNISVPMIIHGFSKNRQTAEMLISNGFYISLGKYLMQNPQMEEVLKSIPPDRLFLETDSMEESIATVYKKATDILGRNIEQEIEHNFNRVFNRDCEFSNEHV